MVNWIEQHLSYVLSLIVLFFSVAFIAYHFAEQLLEQLRFRSLGTRDYIVEKFSQMYVTVNPNTVLTGQIILSLGVAGLIFIIAIPNWLLGGIAAGGWAIVGILLPRPIMNFIVEKRIEKFTLQMVDALNLMAGALTGGKSALQAVGVVAREMANPLKQEMEKIITDTQKGSTLEEAFKRLATRIPTEDVDMFVTSVVILNETGGNMSETFNTISMTIRDRIKLQEKVKALATMAKMQGTILCVVPFAVLVLMTVSDPQQMAPLYHTPLGIAILVTVLLAVIFAYIVIQKLVKIEV